MKAMRPSQKRIYGQCGRFANARIVTGLIASDCNLYMISRGSTVCYLPRLPPRKQGAIRGDDPCLSIHMVM